MSEGTSETSVREIMTSPVLTVTAETGLGEVARTLTEERVGSLVVGDDIVRGIVTETDVVRAVGEGRDRAETSVGELMSDPVVTIRPDESVRVAGERMGHNQVKKLPVTEDGEPVGIVTTTDLAHFFSRDRGGVTARRQRDATEDEFE